MQKASPPEQSQKPIILSLSDLMTGAKKLRLFLYLSALLGMCAFFCFLLSRPVSFTAEGIFKGHSPQQTRSLSKAIEFLEGNDTYASSDDPRSFIRSYPVLEQVVKHLNLQALVIEKSWGKKMRQLWHTFKTERAYHRLKKEKPLSSLPLNTLIPNHPLIPDKPAKITCSSLFFPEEISCNLKIVFQNPETFTVWKHRECLGTGRTDYPFNWSTNSFTLSGTGKKGKAIYLSLIPLEHAIASLQKNLKVQKEKECAQIIHLFFTHQDRHLAAAIVNETMQQFEEYLKNEGKKKITKQLDYLKHRQEEAMLQLDDLMDIHRTYMESHLDSGKMMSLENEIAFIAEKQSRKREALQEIGSEMQRLAVATAKQTAIHLPELLHELEVSRESQSPQALTIESARALIGQHQHQLNLLQLENESYDYCLKKLAEAEFDSSSLSKTLNDPTVLSRFEKMHVLHHRLLDSENWTEKERDHLKTEIDKEKQFMKQHINHLKGGVALQESALKTRVEKLQTELLYLLYDAYSQTQSTLNAYTEQATEFPKKWLSEQKITLNTNLYHEIMESITKMIEAKNMNYHLDSLMMSTLKPAIAPSMPNHPHLLLGALLGGIGALVLMLIILCFYELWQGPSASYNNLLKTSRNVAPNEETVKHLGFQILQQEQVIAIASEKPLTILSSLADWLRNRDDHVYIQEHFSDFPLLKTDIAHLKEQYSRIILYSQSGPKSPETLHLASLADVFIFGIQSERMHALESLPTHTLFYFEPQNVKPVTLQQIRPIVRRFFRTCQKRIALSFLKRALQKRSLKKI